MFALLEDVNKKYLIYIALGFILLTILLVVVYMAIIASYMAKAPLNKDPLNVESLDYASIYSLTFMHGARDFNYTYFFVIFLGIAFVALLIFYFTEKNVSDELNKPVKVGLIALLVAVGLQVVIMIYVGKSINKVKARTDYMNTYICTNIYKNGEFLNKLKIPKNNTIDINSTITDCLSVLRTKVKDPNTLAKGFYSLTLYNYYQSFSSKNLNVDEAYKIFDLNSLLYHQELCRPSGYMPRYGTFIEDIGETIIRKNMPYSKTVNEAMYMCDQMIARTNALANTIYPDEAYNAFILLIVLTIVINALLVSSVYYYGIYKPINLNAV